MGQIISLCNFNHITLTLYKTIHAWSYPKQVITLCMNINMIYID